MDTKVVYNACHGGFQLSDEAFDYMITCLKVGRFPDVLSIVDSNEKDARSTLSDIFLWQEYGPARHHPLLVETVEKLGPNASGFLSSLEVDFVRGSKYFIDEYDGLETVVVPSSICWTHISEGLSDDNNI